MGEINVDCRLPEILKADPRGFRNSYAGDELTMAYAELLSSEIADRLERFARMPVRSVQADADNLIVNLLGAGRIEIFLRFRPGLAGSSPPELIARIKAPQPDGDAVTKLVAEVRDALLGSATGDQKRPG